MNPSASGRSRARVERYAEPHIRTEALAAGFQAHLTKPADAADIVGVIHQLTREPRTVPSQLHGRTIGVTAMRMMLKVSIPVEPGNAGIKDGRLRQITGDALDTLKPEAAYFFAKAVFARPSSSSTSWTRRTSPVFSSRSSEDSTRPWLIPVMNADDLRKALGKLPS